MTPLQLREKTSKELLIVFKSKARCNYSQYEAIMIFRELMNRHGAEMFLKLRIAHSHIIAGEPLNQFDSECDKLINLLD